jgi:hypothetical protein
VPPPLQAAANNLLFHLYGQAGPPWGTSFTDLEELALRLGHTLATERVRQGLARQAQTPPPTAEVCPTGGGPVTAADPEPRTLTTRAAEVGGQEPQRAGGRCRKAFSPQARHRGIDQGSVSPAVPAPIVDAGAHAPSFARAAQDRQHLAGQTIAVQQVERRTRPSGAERVAERTAAIDAWRRRPRRGKGPLPAGVEPPARAVVERDGGRLPSRPPAPEAAAVLEAAAAARPRHGRADKVGCLLRRASPVAADDPCPEIPAVSVTAERALVRAQGIGPCAVAEGAAPSATEPAEPPAPRAGRPERLVRTTVASRQDLEGFGPHRARAAWGRGFCGGQRQAFVADGAAANGTVGRRWFGHVVPVVDFLHALSYLFAAALAGRSFAEGWPVYRRSIQAVWAGEVEAVRTALAARQVEVGAPSPDAGEARPTRVIQDAVTYLANHQDKMR